MYSGPKMSRWNQCVKDNAVADCPVSCGMCATPDTHKCWDKTYTFRRCCGGKDGDSSCFHSGYSFGNCCKLPKYPEAKRCEDFKGMSPSCAELTNSYNCKTPMSKISKDIPSEMKGTVLGDWCRVSCRVCKPPTCPR